MGQYDIGTSTTTDLKGNVDNVTTSPVVPDAQQTGRVWWNFPHSKEYLGYYQDHPEIKSALRVLAQRVAGLGYDSPQKALLENIQGWGNDTFPTIMQQLLIEKKVFGDAFGEIVRNKETGTLINLKKLYTGDMKVIVNEKGIIEGYEQTISGSEGKKRTFTPQQIFHISEDRISNEIHGTSIMISLKRILDAKKEAFEDERKIRHRELALGVLELDTEKESKINAAKTAYQDAVNKGEVLVISKGVAELKDNPNKPRDRVQWLQYLDNLFYQIIGTPKVLVTSEGYTEAGGKAGLLAFEPTEIAEKLKLEESIWNQLAIRVKFNRSPSLLGDAVSNELKNTGQTGFQPNETDVRPTRSE